MTARSLVVSLHDVSPHTHSACARIVDELADCGVLRTSLLVVPDHHQRGSISQAPAFCDWLQRLCREGHEAVLHGYFHQRMRRSGESAYAKLTTRVYTADEGEFFDLDRKAARELVERGEAEFRKAGVAATGFIAPAWLLSSEAEAALRELSFSYTTRLATVLDLQTGCVAQSQSLVWSVRSGWRRTVSVLWNATLFRAIESNPLLRISIHPVDLSHPRIWRQIKALVKAAVRTRDVATYAEWVERQRPASAATGVA